MMRRTLVALAALVALAGCGPVTYPATASAPVDVQPVLLAKPAGLDIPAIDVHATTVAELTLDEHGAMQIPRDPVTVGWYPLGPAPGEPGPAILTGHVNYAGTPGVFARLHELKAGDHITVPRKVGPPAEFVVYAVDQYPKDQFPTDAVFGDTAEPVLRLITCGGELDRAAHSYRDNIVVSAKLT